MRSFSTNVRPVLNGKILFRLWLYSFMIFTVFGLACLVLFETLTSEVGTPGVWIPLAFAFGMHVLLALAIFRKEMRAEPVPFLHWLDGIALGMVLWVGPLAWAKERQKHRQIKASD